MPAVDERGLSEFPTAAQILLTTILFGSVVDASSTSGYDTVKIPAQDLADAILGNFQYTTDLQTDNKTIFGAINNLRVLSGTATPTTAIGSNGQFYVEYTVDGNNDPDAVTGLYFKAGGDWLEISTGGGGSSTLSGLSDVNITTPTNGQLLGYNSTSGKWENITGGGGGGYPVLYGTNDPTSAQGSDGQLYAKYKHSPACFLEVSIYKPIDSTTVSITVTENGTTVYTATPSCTIFGEYTEVTSTITTSSGTYTIKHHGEQHNEADVPSQFVEIDGSEVTFTANGQNSSFPIDETKDLSIDYASYVPTCSLSVYVYKPLDSTTVSITITENGNTIYTATPSCTIYGVYSEVMSTITTSTGTHTIRHWGVYSVQDVPSQFIKIDGDMVSFTAVGDNASFPIDETKSLTVEGGNVITDMWLKQSTIWTPVKL